MATQHHSTSPSDQGQSAEADAAIQAIQDGLDRFFAGDWEKAWRESEPVSVEEFAASLFGGL